MVAPKKVCFKDEDKSPSPQPFEEPEGMVTIDLNSDGSFKQEGDVCTEKSEKVKAKGSKSKTCQTFIYLLMFVTIIFALIIILDDYTDLLKRKQESSKYDWTNKYEDLPLHVQHNIFHERKNKILKCTSSKSLTDCCEWFTHDEFPELVEACILNNLLLSILGNQKTVNKLLRQKRTVNPDGIYENHLPFGNYINRIGQVIADNVPEVLDGLARQEDIYDDYDMNQNSYVPNSNFEYFYDYPHYDGLEHQDLNSQEPISNNFGEQVEPFQPTGIKDGYQNDYSGNSESFPEKSAAFIDPPVQEKYFNAINVKEFTPDTMEDHRKPEEYTQTYPISDYSSPMKKEYFQPINAEEFATKPLEGHGKPDEYLNVNNVSEYTSPVELATRQQADFGRPPVLEKTSQPINIEVFTPKQPMEIINFSPDQMHHSGTPVDFIKISPNSERISSGNKEPISPMNETEPQPKQSEAIIRYSPSLEGETSRTIQEQKSLSEQKTDSKKINSTQNSFPIEEETFQPKTTKDKTSIIRNDTKKLSQSVNEVDTLFKDNQNYLQTTSSQDVSSHSSYINSTYASNSPVAEPEKNKGRIKNKGIVPAVEQLSDQTQFTPMSVKELSSPNSNGNESQTNMTMDNNDLEPDLLGIINNITIPCTVAINGSQSNCDVAKNDDSSSPLSKSDIHIPNVKETGSLIQKLEKNAEEATMKTSKSGFPTGTYELQTSSQTMFTPPCTYPYNYQPYGYNGPYRIAGENGQVYKIVPENSVPKTGQLILNPPMLSYMPISPMTAPFFPNYLPQTNAPEKTIQVSGPGGQFYVCNPISAPANTVMALPGVEVRRQTGKLQDIIQEIPFVRERSTNRSSAITCPFNQFGCEDGSRCLPKHFVCDNEIHCDDGSDEMFCTCRDRVGKLRLCDGYPDCANSEDEKECFGCAPNEFSCDDWSRFRRSTCIPIEQRCDNIRHCEMTGKDEEDCSVLTDNVGNQPQYRVSNAVGYLHRNYKGHWYPSCFGSEQWAAEVCKTEAGPSNIIPKLHMMLSVNDYQKKFINILPNDDISLVNTCVKDRAAFVECPPLYCGMRLSIKNPYRAQEVETSAEDKENDFERVGLSQNSSRFDDEDDSLLQNSRVVGGKPSQPAAWPWLVSIYKNGIFHCGGVIINELWIVTAAHCVDKYWLYYYEIQAGMLRRFSYSPMEQQRWADFIVFHENFDKKKLKNDIGLIKLSSPLRFNRYVRPICLPTESTAGKEFLHGPPDGTICTTVGWGATIEHGTDPDHAREVEVPVQKHCKNQDDRDGDEICAGLSEGGKDACQGDSGGPFMCRNPNNPSQWYLAGIVSHGEGCARPNEPGVYTRVSKYVEWITENMRITKFTNRFPLPKCPGYVCQTTGKCLPKKHHCDRIIDCLFGDDEMNCRYGINDIFSHARKFQSLARFLKDSNGEAEVEPRMETDEDQRTEDSRNVSQEDLQSVNSTFNFGISSSILRKTKENGKDQYFRCTELLQLISHEKRCNKVKDCEDGTDEVNCRCGDYLKIFHPTAVCDGVIDCLDSSDEIACLQCDMSHEYPCRKSQMCLEISKRCDGNIDCSKGEDELDCAALTNGTTLTLDSDLRPESAMSGIITINRFGVWRPFCANMSDDDPSSIATNVCNLLGSEEYVGYHKYRVKDNPLNVTMIAFPGSHYRPKPSRSGNNTCDGLFVTCSNVSLDYSVHNVYLDEVGRNVELYTTPWNAVIYSDGIYRCMGTILNSNWIVTSVNCFKGTTMLKGSFVVAVVGKGKAQLRMQGPHEQILTIIEMQTVTNSDILLLRTNKFINFNRYVNYLPLFNRKNTQRKERCYAVGIHKNETRFVLLKPIERCYVGYRCFESKIKECQDLYKDWSGTVVCDSGSGWYPAAVYSEKNGLCGLSSTKKYTNILYHRKGINEIMQRNPSKVDAPHCDGFRCKLGECINNSETCDGIPNCSDDEDEDSQLCFEKESQCHLTGKCVCPSTHLTCKNKKCVHKSSFCDRKNDCGDKSDEPDICSCRHFLQLSNSSKICDGVINCSDGTDEDPEYCMCKKGSFRCGSSGLCVSNETVCDGANDCPNGEDEKRCLSLVSADNVWLNAGEVLTNTAGVWHNGCFKQNYTSTELDKMCESLGFSGSNANQLTPSKSQDTFKATRPVITPFDVVWIRNESRNKLNFGLRTGNDPYVTFVPDENCFRLFLACI